MQRFFTPRRIGMHITLLVLLPTFALLTWWQFERAYHGNTLSWAYTFEWPLFGGYAIYVWWQLIHDDPSVFTRRRQGAKRGPDGELLGPEEEPGWALTGGRRSKHRGAPLTAADANGATTMLDSPADRQLPGSAAEQKVTEDEDGDEIEEEEDPELAEYNRYLAELNAGPDRKRW